jgi:prepilin-type processing-associated H-X9-DG protein
MEGTGFDAISKRVGSTVLRLTRLTDIVSPGAGQRAVFIDTGQFGSGFYVNYHKPEWRSHSPPPKQHGGGVTLSMADGHAEYWKWKGRETVNIPLKRLPYRDSPNLFSEWIDGPAVPGWNGYEPQTEDGMYDLQRLQKATWGRLGYSTQPP